MKSTLILLLAPVFALGQSTDQISESAKNNAVSQFKSEYVEATFKDPYSFELLKFEATPLTAKQSLEEDCARMIVRKIESDTTSRHFSDLNKEYDKAVKKRSKSKNFRDSLKNEIDVDRLYTLISQQSTNYIESVNMLDKYTNQLATLSAKDRDKTREYKINLDCYGTNSYGAKVLGRYEFYVDLDGNLKTAIKQTNE